jgi:putative ABC transport system substrate-binding protein
MKRREFIRALGGAAAWPLAVRAQQGPMPVVGFLDGTSLEASANRVGAFRAGLKEAGFTEGENVAIDYRWAEYQIERLPALAAELVRRPVVVIAATGGIRAALAAKGATTTIPIVFRLVEDPVRLGLVTSLARPNGNLTGVNALTGEVLAKRLDLFHTLLPAAVRVAVLVNPLTEAAIETTVRDVEAAARVLGLQVQFVNASSSSEIDAVFANFTRERPDALFVGVSALFTTRRVQLANMAARYAIPMTSATREIAEAGGLMSYGTSVLESYRVVGTYVGRILRGAKPTDLPVVQATKFEFVINHQTARMLGITVPPLLLSIADEVIE